MNAKETFRQLGFEVYEGKITVSCYDIKETKYFIYSLKGKSLTTCGCFNEAEINAHIQMLKELGMIEDKVEPVKLQEITLSSDDSVEAKAFVCPSCGKVVDLLDKYCKHCGAKFVEWI